MREIHRRERPEAHYLRNRWSAMRAHFRPVEVVATKSRPGRSCRTPLAPLPRPVAFPKAERSEPGVVDVRSALGIGAEQPSWPGIGDASRRASNPWEGAARSPRSPNAAL